MAAKLIDIKEAAEILGVTPDQLNDMRSRGEIHGYRDGGSWKFKTDEVERVANARAGNDNPFEADDLTFKDPDSFTQHDLTLFKGGEAPIQGLDDESILVSEEALGHSGETTSSTVIGKSIKGESAADSDIQLAADVGGSSISGSDVNLIADMGTGSNVKLVAGGSDVLKGGSDVKQGGSDVLAGGSDKKGPSDTGKLGGSDLSLDDDPLEMSVGSSLTLGDDDDEEKPIRSPSPAGSGLVLGEDEDDDLVLGGSSGGSDLTLGAGGSGINLTPTDSGLNLEQPLDLVGSGVEALELPEDDDMISLDDMSADPNAATQLKADDDFLLTPVEEQFVDDDSSGSQVIALEDSEAYADENARTLLGSQAGRALEAAAADPFAAGLDSLAMQPGQGAPAMTAQPVMAPAPVAYSPAGLPEAPYSIWNVLSLMFIVCFLGMIGMLMTDLMRNMWSFDSSYPATSQLMDWWVQVFKLD